MTRKILPQPVPSRRRSRGTGLCAQPQGEFIQTGGELFPSGPVVSLILDPKTRDLKLLLSDGKSDAIRVGIRVRREDLRSAERLIFS